MGNNRSSLVHPTLNSPGGVSLWNSIDTIYQLLSDNDIGRWIPFTALANSGTTTIIHGFGVPFTDLKVIVYTGSYPNVTQNTSFVAVANGSSPKTQIDVTAPSSGGPFSGYVLVVHDVAWQQRNVTTAQRNAIASPNKGMLVFDTDLNSLYVYMGSAWIAAGAGAGAGELNIILNPSDANLGWAASGAGITVATSSTSTDLPLAGIFPTSIKVTPISGTDYVYYRFTMPAALKQRKLKIQWEQRPLSGYASGDLKVDMYTNTASGYGGTYVRQALSTDASAVTGIPNLFGRVVTTWDSDTSDFYELRITRVAGTTALNLANVIVGPGIQSQGPIVGQWISFTSVIKATGSDPTKGTNVEKSFYRRVGSNMEVEFCYTQSSGGSAGSGLYYIQIPGGYNLDPNKLIPNDCIACGSVFGGPNTSITGTAIAGIGFFAPGVQGIGASLGNSVNPTTYWASGFVGLTGGMQMRWTCTIPIAEWADSGTVQLGQNDVEYASNASSTDANDTTSFVNGPAGSSGILATTNLSAIRKKRIRFTSPIQYTDRLTIEYASSSSGPWIPIAEGAYETGLVPFVFQSSNSYGMCLDTTPSGIATDIDIIFGVYCYPSGASYGGTGAQWSTAFPAGYKWRVKKQKAGIAIGFGLADTQGNAGLVNPYSASSAGVVYSSFYTPIRTNISNVSSSTTYPWQVLRVGRVVTVSGRIDIQPSASGGAPVLINLSLPIVNGASTFAGSTSGAAGLFTSATGTLTGSISPLPGTQTVALSLTSNTTSNSSYWGQFTYEIP